LYGKNGPSVHEVMKNKEKILARFSVATETANITAIARDKVLMKVGKTLNLWVEKHFYFLSSALMEKHDFNCSVIP